MFYPYLPDNWDRKKHPMKKNSFGVFEIVLPAIGGVSPIAHNSKVKVSFANQIEIR